MNRLWAEEAFAPNAYTATLIKAKVDAHVVTATIFFTKVF